MGLFLFLITITRLLSAQESDYQFETLDSRHGLSNNHVNTIFQDEKGFIWFGTMAGLDRYDGYSFKTFKHKAGDTTSINDDLVTRIVEGPDHKLWILTPNGWNIFDPRTEKFSTHDFTNNIGIADESFTAMLKGKLANFWFLFPGKGVYKYNSTKRAGSLYNRSSASPLYSNNLSGIAVDKMGCLWIIYMEGVLQKIDAEGKLLFSKAIFPAPTKEQHFSYRLFIDKDNDIWIYTRGEAKGVFYYRPSQNYLLPINKETKFIRLNNDIINGIEQDEKGLIWIATDHGGINLIDKKNFSIRYLTSDETNPRSLSQNSINYVYKDNAGIIWIGTFKKGVNQFHANSLKFPLYQHQPGRPNSLVYNDVNRFVEDKNGNLWIGTNGGGLLYFNRTLGTFKQYLHDARQPNSLSNNVIVSLFIDQQEKLWIGTYYGGMDCYDGHTFHHYKHDDQNPTSLADDRVWEIFEDSQQRFWVGTLSEGLELFNKAKGTFIHYKPGANNNSVHSNYISCITEDKEKNIWLATAHGVDLLDKRTGMFRHFEHIEGDKASLSNNNVIKILEDSRGLIWIGTRDGLNLYDPATKLFTIFRTDDGLPDNAVLTLLEDDNHHLWITTPNGLANMIVSKKAGGDFAFQFKTYDETDGLQGRQFNEYAACKTRRGELIVGGTNGFNIFQPAAIKENMSALKLIITDLQIFNDRIKIGKAYKGKIILPESITDVKELNLKYNQNVFTIEFAALRFINPDKIKYAYKLSGFNEEWLTTDASNRKATFTNLDPGSYTLFIKASNEDGTWSKEQLTLKINILPPFWLTSYAYLVYVLLLIAALFLARKLVLRRANLRFQLERERQEAQRLHELDMMKIKFFTNVSHEFRTPLSLIISPMEKLLKEAGADKEKKQFQLIYRNARRLLNLVNELLDFRKLEEQELRLHKTGGDIIHFIKEMAYSFSDIAENKKIDFSVQANEEFIFTSFDHDKLERILFNLLSNAFKFTPVNGTVKVLIACSAEATEKSIQIKIIDTGIGISKDKHEKIFERFFQNEIPGSILNQGSGIGLAITKEFVRMHKGTISVESEIDKGSCFTVLIPIVPLEIENAGALSKIEEIILLPEPLAELPNGTDKNRRGNKKTLLLVEDNDDFRFYIKDNLKAHYIIIEAANGKLGWQKALSEHPDLIVCDINMPEMNGIDLCKKVKADVRTSFIPVILLTALTGEEKQLEGLQTGANDYITKPFNFEILFSKIKNQLLQQESFKKTYQKQVQVQATEVVNESADDRFIQQVLVAIEKNIANPDFSVEELSRKLFMSRVALYKKLFALSGKSPSEFIRSIRLQRAAQLLKKKELTIAEVAYEVGFNSPKYFSKYFKSAYNVLPSAYYDEVKKQEQEANAG